MVRREVSPNWQSNIAHGDEQSNAASFFLAKVFNSFVDKFVEKGVRESVWPEKH